MCPAGGWWRMQQISEARLNEIAAAGEILAKDDEFIRAVRASDGRIWKQFRKKSLPSSSAIWPYAKRFIRAAKLLRQRGINTVAVRDVYKVGDTGRHVVVYDELPGRSLRHVLESDSVKCLADFAAFMALLHDRGVYFRSMHLDNVLVLDTGAFALIDVTHVTFCRRPLGPWRRARNFRPVTSYSEDRALLEQFERRRFLEEYLAASQLDAGVYRRFLAHLGRLNGFFAGAAREIRKEHCPRRAPASMRRTTV